MTEVKPSAYLETTIPSYLTAWPSRDLIVATHQQITKDWWRTAPGRYELYISQTVLDEATAGDPDAGGERLALLRGVSVLPPSDDTQPLATADVDLLHLPPRAIADSLHLAYAVRYEVDYLVTWNMRHWRTASRCGG
jgi:hypothetical protein